jgi:hypothetical protein
MAERLGPWVVTRLPPDQPPTAPAFVPGTVIQVPSRSRPGVSYAVKVGPRGGLSCSCPGFKFRHECAHVQPVREGNKP